MAKSPKANPNCLIQWGKAFNFKSPWGQQLPFKGYGGQQRHFSKPLRPGASFPRKSHWADFTSGAIGPPITISEPLGPPNFTSRAIGPTITIYSAIGANIHIQSHWGQNSFSKAIGANVHFQEPFGPPFTISGFTGVKTMIQKSHWGHSLQF